MPATSHLKHLLTQPDVIKAPGVYDGLSARLVERAGFEVGFVSGACVSFARLGKPDIGLVDLGELATCVAQIRERVMMSLIVDIDTGFGNAINCQRTVKLLEQMGASALQIEDQLMPKRCGHMAGKQVISCDEMVGKVKACLDARRSDDTLIFVRTDAIGVNGFDDAMERAEKYVQAGADALFMEAPKTVEQMQIIQQEFAHRVPLIHNLVKGGGSPVAGANELAELDYKIALYPAALLKTYIPKAESLLNHIRTMGETASLEDTCDLNYVNQILDSEGELALLEKYA